jgi:hypothetical protein
MFLYIEIGLSKGAPIRKKFSDEQFLLRFSGRPFSFRSDRAPAAIKGAKFIASCGGFES